MAAQGSAKDAPLGERGQSLYLGSIRTIFNAAQKEYNDYDKGDIVIPNHPFVRFKVPRARSIKTAEQKALSIEQIKAIRDYIPVSKSDELAHDCFMLSFYFCGMNSVDLYQCSELQNGIIRYYRSKVTGRRNDKAEMRICVEQEALSLIEKYCDHDKNRVFCFYKMYSTSNSFSGAINGRENRKKEGTTTSGLKTIGKAVGTTDLEFYYARHSWATIAANICDIPVDTIDDCLAHSDNRVAKKSYIKKDWTKMFAANRAVLDVLIS
jgi:integrase